MRETAKYIARRGHGILAADESNATTNKRLEAVGLEACEENRRAWREVLWTAPGLGQYISGTIMFHDSTEHATKDGTPFMSVLEAQGIKAGIKLDTGLQPLPGTDGETATQGLDGLADRCRDYYAKGCRFAKWRAVLNVGGGRPSTMAVAENAHALARYAQIAQAAGLVPIVEPEVTLGPGTYGIDETAYVSERVYSDVMK
jgi:fructose-bisphosphate aldolase class I